MKAKNWLLELIVYLLAALFFMAAGSKLADLETFTRQINNQPFDNRFTPLLVIGVPTLEMILAIAFNS